MNLLCYIDNEVPGFGEWDAVAADGDSSVAQCSEAGFDERGELGLRFQSGWDSVHVEKNLPAPREHMSVGFWLRVSQSPSWAWGVTEIDICRAVRCDGGDVAMRLMLCSYGDSQRLELRQTTDSGESVAGDDLAITVGRWYYVVATCRWGDDDCDGKLYIDGALRAQCASTSPGASRRPDRLRIGCMRDDYVCTAVLDFDEIKLADDYVEPFRAAPTGETPDPARTVVLFNQLSSGSRDFADHCVATLGIPRGNLCPLPNASNDETLSDYAAFQNQVEDDLTVWLASNPTAAERCMCLLLGPNVPGYFIHQGRKHSATSRLMNLSQPFSPGCANPLYKPQKVVRLDKSELNGLYLVSRIDADSFSRAMSIVTRAVSVSLLAVLDGDNILYCDDAYYRSSLACGRLRLPTADISTLESDDFAWGMLGDPQFAAPGARVALASMSASSGSTLRSASSPCSKAILEAGYPAAVGSSDDAETFDVESFFEMLRIGGTFAEAVAVAASRLDYTSVTTGVATMTVALPKAGLNVYHGVGSADAIDYSSPVAYLRDAQTTANVPLSLAPGEQHFVGVREVSVDGVEETNSDAVACARADAAGALLDAPLPTPTDVTADVCGPQSVLVGFSCRPRPGLGEPEQFEVLSDGGSGVLDTDNPVATVAARNTQGDFQTVVADVPLPAVFAVRCRRGEQTGPPSRTVLAAVDDVRAATLL